MNSTSGYAAPSGRIGLRVLRGGSYSDVPARDLTIREIIRHGFPRPGLPAGVAGWRFKNLPNLFRGLWLILFAKLTGTLVVYGAVSLVKMTHQGPVNYGLASLRVVTTAGVNFIRDAFLNTTELETLKYHGFGTGTTAEAVGDTALVTELTTEYATDNTRPTGTQVSGGTGAYQTVATLSPDGSGTLAITEHGIFSQAATGGGTLLDRSVFSAVNLVRGSDSLQVTYTITFTAGG
jgi:hypothetical protein